MNPRFYDPKTTIGGIVILAALLFMWTGKLSFENTISLMGVAGAWIGFAAKDGNKP